MLMPHGKCSVAEQTTLILKAQKLESLDPHSCEEIAIKRNQNAINTQYRCMGNSARECDDTGQTLR